MTQWETCEIDLVTLQKRKRGMFKSTSPICQWEAKRMTPSGSEVIFKSDEFEVKVGISDVTDMADTNYFPKGENEICDVEYDKMIGHLGSKGWQPSRTNRNRWVTLMKRQVDESEKVNKAHIGPRSTTSPVDLLKQLTNLRDAGILTEQEFQTKKAEILKRI